MISFLRLVFCFLFLLGLFSCKHKGAKHLGDGLTIISSEEGWVNDNLYKMQVYGQWNRKRYYIEGEPEQKGKFAKPFYGLRASAKTAAKVRAMRNFKEKIVSNIQSETKVEDQALISEVVNLSLKGVVVAPQAVKEMYSKRHDVVILFHFEAKGLKKMVDKMAIETLKKVEDIKEKEMKLEQKKKNKKKEQEE